MKPPSRAPRFPASLASPTAREAQGAGGLLRPQRPLEHAQAQRVAGRAVPSGLGLDSASVRARMVQRLQREGGLSAAVLAALQAIERHRFVDSALANQAYEDTSLPIGHGQTISKPSVVARMLSLAMDGERARAAGGLGRVLEIGTGCGYQAALLAMLARQVVSIERLRSLHELAARRLEGHAMRPRIRLVWGDGRDGHAPLAPYDAIVAAAGGDELPGAWLDQLAVGGRLVAPVADADRRVQRLRVVDRTPDGLVSRTHEAVLFVPLKSGAA